TAALFWALSPVMLDVSGWRIEAVAIFALVGLFFPAVVTLLNYESNQRLGPTISAAVGSIAPLFATAAAAAFLGERLTPQAARAAVVLVAGIVVLSWHPGESARWPLRLLLLPLSAAALRGLAQAGTKLGLAFWPSPFAASLINYTVSVGSVAANAQLRTGTL